MRIVNRSEFLTLPNGTVYSNYMPQVIGGLYIKRDALKTGNDWVYQDLIDSIDCNGSSERADILFEAEENGRTFKMDLQCGSRDGCFETEQYFLIYDKSDTENLIQRLSMVVNP